MFRTVILAAVTAFAIGLPAPVAAQQTMTQDDLLRLQDNIYQAERELTVLRTSDTARAAQFRLSLDELRDEVTYLKVKMRKEPSVARAEYSDLRDRIDDLRADARRDAPRAAAPAPAPAPTPTPAPAPAPRPVAAANPNEVPAGTEMDVRLSQALNSATAQVEDFFEATTLVDLEVSGRVLIPAGSVLRGMVTQVTPATRTNRQASMTVNFDRITVNGRAQPLRATVTEALESEGLRGEAGRVGAGAGVGAVIGGLLGGFKGALAGILIGGGGTIAATEGQDLNLPQGSVLRVRIDSPLTLQ